MQASTDTPVPPRQHVVDHRALLALLLKHYGVHEGTWMLQAHFTLAAGNMGPTPEEVAPTAFVGLQKLGIVEVKNTERHSLILDAAEVNPAPPAKLKRSSKKAGAI